MDDEAPSAGSLFSRSLEAFRASLTDQERAEFRQYATSETMLAELKLYYHLRGNRKIEESCRKVAKFAEKLQMYFNVIGAFVQTNPEYSGWFWGVTLLICKLGSNYAGFFEKTSDMLEHIASMLPQYKDHMDIFQRRNDVRNDRLGKMLALVYADIFGFCHHLHTMLTGRKMRNKWQRSVALVGKVLWSPFDIRFGQLTERLRRHDVLFRQEVKVQDSKMIDRLQETMDRNFKNLERSIESSYVRIDSVMEANLAGSLIKNIEKQESLIKAWMGAVDYRSIYESAKQYRRDGSCEWFLSLDSYISWRDRPFSSQAQGPDASELVPGIVSVQAKPGFGKTVLSTAIIEDLESRYPSSSVARHDQEEPTPSIAYFHFTRELGLGVNTGIRQALQSFVTQIAHSLRFEPNVIDMLAFMRWDGASGQSEASTEDAKHALRFLLSTQPVYIVLDGIDECFEHETLLKTLSQLTMGTESRMILLSRPDIVVPRLLKNIFSCPPIMLSAEHNYPDILAKMTDELQDLVDCGLFGNRPISTDASQIASRHANGIFLWARLFISYLRSPGLTPKIRHRFLVDAVAFEGLIGLVKVILKRLNESGGHEKASALNIFRWVAVSLYPLSTKTLHTALAITPGEETTDLDYLSNFPDCLPQLTGALVEIGAFGRPAFIHASVKECLLSPEATIPQYFSLAKQAQVHEYLVNCCLSYLIHDIPRQPVLVLRAIASGNEVDSEHPRSPNPVPSTTQGDRAEHETSQPSLGRPPAFASPGVDGNLHGLTFRSANLQGLGGPQIGVPAVQNASIHLEAALWGLQTALPGLQTAVINLNQQTTVPSLQMDAPSLSTTMRNLQCAIVDVHTALIGVQHGFPDLQVFSVRLPASIRDLQAAFPVLRISLIGLENAMLGLEFVDPDLQTSTVSLKASFRSLQIAFPELLAATLSLHAAFPGVQPAFPDPQTHGYPGFGLSPSYQPSLGTSNADGNQLGQKDPTRRAGMSNVAPSPAHWNQGIGVNPICHGNIPRSTNSEGSQSGTSRAENQNILHPTYSRAPSTPLMHQWSPRLTSEQTEPRDSHRMIPRVPTGTRNHFAAHDGPAVHLEEASEIATGQEQSLPYRDRKSPPAAQQRSTVEFAGEYTFLRYSTLAWVSHLWRSLPPKHRRVGESDTLSPTPPLNRRPFFDSFGNIILDSSHHVATLPSWAPSLSRFLLCRAAVTNWTMMSYHYRLTPTLGVLLESVRSLASEFGYENTESREIQWIVQGLHQLSEALDELTKTHAASLRENPTLLWQRDITSATDSAFWPTFSNHEPSGLGSRSPKSWTREPFCSSQSFCEGLNSDHEPSIIHKDLM